MKMCTNFLVATKSMICSVNKLGSIEEIRNLSMPSTRLELLVGQ